MNDIMTCDLQTVLQVTPAAQVEATLVDAAQRKRSPE